MINVVMGFTSFKGNGTSYLTQMPFVFTETERRQTARLYLDSAELWLRKLVDFQLSQAFGPSYFTGALPGGGPIIAPKIQRKAAIRLADPKRHARVLDAIDFDDAITIVFYPSLHNTYFRDALNSAYPLGQAQARFFLKKLNELRNKIAHQGTCSSRELEQSVCYSNDLIDGLKVFYERNNMGRDFNVPLFVRVVDNYGNEQHLTPPRLGQAHFADFTDKPLYSGNRVVVEAEVDKSFDEWNVSWTVLHTGQYRGEGTIADVTLADSDVGEQFDFRFLVTSNKSWHRLRDYDDLLDVRYRVLPRP